MLVAVLHPCNEIRNCTWINLSRRWNINLATMVSFMFLLSLLGSTEAVPNTTCNRLKIGEHFYDQEVIWGLTNKGRPYNLNVHRSSNMLFFSYHVNHLQSLIDVDFQVSYVDLDSKESQVIAGIRGGFAVAVNQNTDDVYLGGSEGIYRYNMLTKIADFYKENGVNIWSLFYNKNLFYISYPDQKLHIEVDGNFARVKEFNDFEVDHFHISNEGHIYFSNKTGVYFFDNVRMKVKVISELLTLRQIAEDNEGNVYFCTNFGIHVISKDSDLKRIVDMRNIFGIAFDKDNNFIISDEKYVIKLKQSKVGCLPEPNW